MAFDIVITEAAKTDFKKLDTAISKRIIKKLASLHEYEDVSHVAKQLTGEWSEYSKIRVGSYRVICIVASDTIVVHRVRKRGRVYRA